LGKSNLNIKGTNKEKSIPQRSKQAIKDLLDLSEFYTASLDDDLLAKPGNNLKSLPKGVQALPSAPVNKFYEEGLHALPRGCTYTKAAFDIRGLIQLAGKKTGKEAGIVLPESVKGIKVHFKGTKIHFFHGASGVVEENTKIGEYILNYADGQRKSIPIIYGQNTKDLWIKKGDPIPADADIAWIGENEASRKSGYDVQLYKYSANNPLPDIELKTIDFVSELTDSAPFLIAVTVEAIKTVYESYEWFDSPTVCNDIIPRSEEASSNQVDLTNYYNASLDDDWFHHSGHDLHDVPKGLQVFKGVKFDVRGLIQLAGGALSSAGAGSPSVGSLWITGLALPEELSGIKVNLKGRLVHFLHACAFSSEFGTKIGAYIMHYANGETKEAPIIYGKNVVDWWVWPNEENKTEVEQAWSGSNAATRRAGQKTQLLKYTWKNPLPDVEITSIDFITSLSNSAPFLIAVTLET
jgi:hypothetical protein